jgi:hypothetical protein
MKRIFHNGCLLSAVMLLVLSLAPINVLADGGEDEITQTVDGYRVTLVFEKPIANGENPIHLQVSHAQGQPVSNAHVEVRVVEAEAEHTEAESHASQGDNHGMDGMDGTHSSPSEHDEMEIVTFTAGHEEGEYAGEIVVADSGEWTLQVHLAVAGHLVEFDFPLHIASSQAGKNILLGFFAINAVILGTAATLKLKPAASPRKGLSHD